jgi:hypothetical protein
VSAFGDVFFVDRNNRIHFLDASFGVLEEVAGSNDELRQRMNSDLLFTRQLLRLDLFDQLKSRAPLGPEQVYWFKAPLQFGGPPTAENVTPVTAGFALDFLGQVNAGTAELQTGAEFAMNFAGFPGHDANEPPTRARKAPRDRPSLAKR